VKPPTISVNIYDPLVRGDPQYYRRIIPNAYSHTISAFGGYDSATLTIAADQGEAEDWLEYGLGRHVKVHAAALDCVWEGFIDEIRFNVGPLTVTYGPLLAMTNRVMVAFTNMSEGNAYFIYGSEEFTDVANDLASQARYGIQSVILNAGQQMAEDAEYIRDTWLEANRWPKLTQSWSMGGAQPVTVTLTCKGYYYLLNYPYRGILGMDYASTKIEAVLNYNPNVAWLPFNSDNVDENTLEYPTESYEGHTGLSTIQDVVSRGDASGNRWLFCVLNDRKVYYYQAPTTPDYRAYVRQGGLILTSPEQAIIEPHRLRPGKWLAFYDFLVGRNITEVASDPRMMFIERVTYRAPDGLQLEGGTTDEINQLLAQWGIGGAV